VKCFSYKIGAGFFTNSWCWFDIPHEVKASLSNFFSYDSVDVVGFKRKRGMTSVINLQKDEDEIWSAMRKKFTSNLIREGEKRGIVIHRDGDLGAFKKLYRRFRHKKDIVSDNASAFSNGILFTAHHNDRMIGGHIFIGDGTYMRSWVAASLRLERVEWKDRRLIGCANRMIIWEAIKYAKANGYTLFDLGGINPESSVAWERTLAEFKESFGGERKECYYYSRVNSPLLKLLFRVRSFLPI